MKKLFTIALALMGLTVVANAASVDDIALLKHSYVLVCDNYTGNGTVARTKGGLFGANHFLDVTGGSIATNKGKATLGDATTLVPFNCTQEEVEAIAAKYAKYTTPQLNSLRLKNAQDVIAMKVTAGTKVIFVGQGNNKSGKDARIPKIAKDAKLESALNDAPTAESGSTPAGYVYQWTAKDDMTIYVGSYNGDMFLSYIIVEANEAPGTPLVELSDQTFDGTLWSRTITVEPQLCEGQETVVLYTTDGSDPVFSNSGAEIYDNPIICYKDQTVRMQAYLKALVDLGMEDESAMCEGADYDVTVDFSFKAPSISDDGNGNVAIATEYDNATNVYSYGDVVGEGNTFTLTQSATVTAYTKINNGEYTTFETLPATADVYVLNAITEAKKIAVTGGDVVVDEEATANATDGQTVYTVENGVISADPMDFFVKNLTFKVVNGGDAVYQVPAGEERYIQMSNTNISFKVQKPVHVKVTTTLNSCKTLNPTDDENITTDRKNYVNVSGTNYGNDDVTAEGGNIIEFDLPAKVQDTQDVFDGDGNKIGTENVGEPYFPDLGEGKIFTFQKYSGTGNILISSIEIAPVSQSGSATKGDINGDGTVDIADLNLIIDKMSGISISGDADVNGDGTVDIADLNIVIDIMSGE